jgi:hypothetical protein
MFTPFLRKQLNRLVPAALLLTLAGFASAPPAFARLAVNTIDPEASVSADGRQLVVTGPCRIEPAGERVSLRVTVTQRTTGAVAEGRVFFTGTGELQHWELRATTRGQPSFAPGAATATAIATTRAGAETTDAHQWLVQITLVSE